MWWTDPSRASRRGLALVAAAVGCAGALAGCSAGSLGGPPLAKPVAFRADAPTPLDQYAVKVERAPDQLALSVHAAGLSANQRAALEDFAGRWRETGGAQAMVVQAPLNSREPADPRAAAEAVVATLGALGVPPSRLRVADYDAAGRPDAPVIARYERYLATGPDCRQGWDNLVATDKNTPSTHFGCAAAANLAVMVANARDLQQPSPMAPADSVRRAVVLDKYRQGVITSSPKDPQAEGVVSSAVN